MAKVANPFASRQRLMAQPLGGIEINRLNGFQVGIQYRSRQLVERGEQFNAGLLVIFYFEIIAAGFQPGGVGLFCTLRRFFQVLTLHLCAVPL